jgi:hypothetical protein
MKGAAFTNKHFRCDDCQRTVIKSVPKPMPAHFKLACEICDKPMYLQGAGKVPRDRRAADQIKAEREAFIAARLPEVDHRINTTEKI